MVGVRSDHLNSAVRPLGEPDRDLVARTDVTAGRENTHHTSLSYRRRSDHVPKLRPSGVQLNAGVSQAGDPDNRSLPQLKQRSLRQLYQGDAGGEDILTDRGSPE